MGDFIFEHKKLSYFTVFLFIFYFFIAVPLEKNIENRRTLQRKISKLDNMETKQKILLKNLEDLKTEKEILNKNFQNIYNENRNFNSVGEYQNYLNKFLIKNNIEILETARTIKNEIEYIIPYTVKGAEKDIINFILEAEKDRDINLMKGPVEFKKEKNSIKFRFSTGVKILENSDVKNIEETRAGNFFDSINQKIKLINYVLMDNNKGIFYFDLLSELSFDLEKNNFEKNLKKYYLKDGEEAFIGSEKYLIKIENKKLILKSRENLENIRVFNLGEKN